MKNRVLATLALVGLVAARTAAADGVSCSDFSELAMTLERNATDGDTEVVFFAQGGDEGLGRLAIIAPGGRRVAKFEGDRRGIGLREFLLESAEPPDLERVLASFPEGPYTFNGTTVDAECLRGSALLSHEIAPETTLLSPAEDEEVPASQLVLSWAPVAQAERYIVELNNEDSGSEFTFEVFPPTTSLTIPSSLVEAGSEYQFGVGVRTPNGNVTFVELNFTTAEEGS